MEQHRSLRNQRVSETENLKSFIRALEVNLVGIADLNQLEGMPIGLPFDSSGLLQKYQYAIVLGAQLGKLGDNVSGTETALFLEKAAFEVMGYLEEKRYKLLIIHTEDEFDPFKRIGLMSLKVLA